MLALVKKISNSLILSRVEFFEGKCGLCREKDKKAFIKKHMEYKRKIHATKAKLNEAMEEATTIKMTIREAKKEIDSEVSDGGSTAATTPEETASGAKLLEQCPPPSPPNHESTSHFNIKVENDEGTFSHEKYVKWKESGREAGQITKKQKTGKADIGSWVAIKWAAVNSRDEDNKNAASTTSGIDSDANAKTESSEFTFGSFPADFQ